MKFRAKLFFLRRTIKIPNNRNANKAGMRKKPIVRAPRITKERVIPAQIQGTTFQNGFSAGTFL
jgi:hypothetical protein